ncbi:MULTISPECIES: LicD family protein [unclassified Parvimonas]|uniref:LicD family protein n=1 Tax=unclassified Parvimonas TaxID=1151464 RepID=UPI002B4A69C9|nr:MULTISPECIES: LicD family protein [unclassified Parvimonas]MEB3025331.1 LicD family protein [Parvimonas sp. M13]MEB3089425.1 LicD family protein [Parvimonas sp. M20]
MIFKFDSKNTWKIKSEFKKGKFDIDFEALKKKELEILKNFISCCEKMNLTYYISYGTLLGAIRHKGFIPWDDDIDVCMPRGDYDRFIKEGSEYLPENYFIQTMESDPKYALNFAKLRDSNTALFEKHVLDVDINHGVFIDIFPVDGYIKGQNKVLDLRVKEKPVFEEADTNAFSNALSGFSKKFVYKLSETIPNKLKIDLSKNSIPKDNPKFEDCEYVACLVDSFYIIPFKRALLGKGIKVDFENIKANAPENYDEYLRVLYGDYMKLPPESQRENHHNFHLADVNKSFREYQEKI